MEQDIRWKQRFEHFEKAYFQMQRFMAKETLNEFELQGLIQCFEYTYELAWNVMKDFLFYQGITGISGSRDAFRQAFNKELIKQGNDWMQMVDDRIITVHSYNEETTKLIESRIKQIYYPLFTDFYEKMKTHL